MNTETTRLEVHFQPEAWQNDHAVPVDDEGDDTWEVAVDTATAIREAGRSDLDFVQQDPNAPAWVTNWRGPFTISVVESFESDD